MTMLNFQPFGAEASLVRYVTGAEYLARNLFNVINAAINVAQYITNHEIGIDSGIDMGGLYAFNSDAFYTMVSSSRDYGTHFLPKDLDAVARFVGPYYSILPLTAHAGVNYAMSINNPSVLILVANFNSISVSRPNTGSVEFIAATARRDSAYALLDWHNQEQANAEWSVIYSAWSNETGYAAYYAALKQQQQAYILLYVAAYWAVVAYYKARMQDILAFEIASRAALVVLRGTASIEANTFIAARDAYRLNRTTANKDIFVAATAAYIKADALATINKNPYTSYIDTYVRAVIAYNTLAKLKDEPNTVTTVIAYINTEIYLAHFDYYLAMADYKITRANEILNYIAGSESTYIVDYLAYPRLDDAHLQAIASSIIGVRDIYLDALYEYTFIYTQSRARASNPLESAIILAVHADGPIVTKECTLYVAWSGAIFYQYAITFWVANNAYGLFLRALYIARMHARLALMVKTKKTKNTISYDITVYSSDGQNYVESTPTLASAYETEWVTLQDYIDSPFHNSSEASIAVGLMDTARGYGATPMDISGISSNFVLQRNTILTAYNALPDVV